jgi:hypothetical protein
MKREEITIIIQPVMRLPMLDRGLFNGYIIIPPGHPWHGMDYVEIDASVHGGLTYAAAEGDDGWMIGFDTAHYGDTAENWPVGRVAEQCHLLMIQALDAAEAAEII